MIEVVSKDNLKDVLPLIRKYQEFYKIADISDERNKEFFSQFGEYSDKGCLFLYRNGDGATLGFATVYLTFVSSIPAKVGVMNDLYVLDSERGKGIGRKLIATCYEYAKSKGAVRIQWLTAETNERAQQLYDSLETNKSKWLVYTYTGSS